MISRRRYKSSIQKKENMMLNSNKLKINIRYKFKKQRLHGKLGVFLKI